MESRFLTPSVRETNHDLLDHSKGSKDGDVAVEVDINIFQEARSAESNPTFLAAVGRKWSGRLS